MSAPSPFNAGTQLVTADAAIGTSGQPARVYNVHLFSSGGGGGSVALRNGTSTAGTIYVQLDGTTSKGITVDFGTYGYMFPAGCFVDLLDGNTTSILVSYSQ